MLLHAFAFGFVRSDPCRWHVLEERGHISNRQLAALREVLRPPGSSQMDPSALSPTHD